MDLSGIIILTNKIYNNDSNITEFKKYYQNNIKYIRSLVYTAQEYCNYNDTSLSSIDKNLFVNDPLFRKNTKNKNNIISDNSFSLFYFIDTGDKLLDASFQKHIYDNSNNIIIEINDLWNTTISYETLDISNIYNKYNKSLSEFTTKPPWNGLPSSDISWDLINVNLNTGYSINSSIKDICNNLKASRACVLVNNSEDISLIKSSKSDWDQSVYRILAEDVKHFHAPHITQYNKDRDIHRNIYWADISGMDIPLGKIQDPSTCIPIWVQLESTNDNIEEQPQTKEINTQSTGYFKSNRWYLLSLLTHENITIKENVQQYMSGIYPNKIYIPNNSEYDNNISINDFDLSINEYIQDYSNNVVKNRYNIDSIPAWIYVGNNRDTLPSNITKITIYKQETEILIVLPSVNIFSSDYYYYGKNNFDDYSKIKLDIEANNLYQYFSLENTPEFGIGNLFSIEFKNDLTQENCDYLNQYNNIILSDNKKFIYIVNDKDTLLPGQILYKASLDNQNTDYIIDNTPNSLPDISNVYINLEDGSGNIMLYDAKNISNINGENIIDICNLDINTYGL
tara:strand:+ start:1755 stop:3455 length:1701 start_codon:yes stop_codon:yes gene_type:complete